MNQLGDYLKTNLKYRLLYASLPFFIGGPLVCLCLFVLLRFVLPWLDKVRIEEIASPGLLAAGIGLIAFLALMAFAFGLAWVVVRRRTAWLDAVFTPLGLTGSPYMLQFRQYHGQIGGRPVDVYFFRGPTLEIHLGADISTGLRVFDRDSLQTASASVFNKTPLELKAGLLEDFAVFAADQSWARAVLETYGAAGAVQTLMNEGADWSLFRRLELSPGEVLLHIYRSKTVTQFLLESQAVRRWLAEMRQLAEAAESLPEPQVKEQRTAQGPEARQKISRITAWAVAVVLIGVPLCAIGGGLIAYLLVIN